MKRAFHVVGIVVAGVLALLALLLSPLLIGVWLFGLVYGCVLAAAWWRKHGRVGRRFLVVYSNSPKWAAFFTEEVVPLLAAIVIHFRHAWRAETVRFFEAFQLLQRGDSSQLNAQLAKVQQLAAAMGHA